MGTWGVGLFADDVACDVRDHYRELLEDGVDDHEATRRTIEKFRDYFEESDGIALLALAATQSTLGRLAPEIRVRALAALDRGADLEEWERDNPKLLSRRRATLEKLRAQLTGEQPKRRAVRPPRRVASGLTAGDVLALDLPERVVLLRVVRVRQHRRGDNPVLEELDYHGKEVPSADVMERLQAKTTNPIPLMTALSPDMRFFTFVMQRVGWEAAGFRIVARISGRPGDDDAVLPSSGISWARLAERCRRR